MNSPASKIRLLSRKEIDIAKWDLCIEESPNGLIYARHFYLDSMSKKWNALVLGDYETVMPLTWNRKFGFSYLYQPPFTAQLGVFSRQLRQENIDNFISETKTHFRFAEIHLNFANSLSETIQRANYILDLERPYAEIKKDYSTRIQDYLKKSVATGLRYVVSVDFNTAIKLFREQYSKRFSHVRKEDFQNFELLCRELSERKMVIVREVKDKFDNLLCINIFFLDRNRIYNIMPVTLPAGKDLRAQFYMVDSLIHEFSTKDLILDFEGSEIPGIATFYMKFGSLNQPYSFLKFNQLPFPFRYFK